MWGSYLTLETKKGNHPLFQYSANQSCPGTVLARLPHLRLAIRGEAITSIHHCRRRPHGQPRCLLGFVLHLPHIANRLCSYQPAVLWLLLCPLRDPVNI